MIACLLLTAGLAGAGDVALPEGWRAPTPAELTDPIRDASPSRYTMAVADFDGDGTDDTARMLNSVVGSKESLWVHLSSDGDARWIKLAEFERKDAAKGDIGMAVETGETGVVAYACFDDSPGECNFGPHEQRPKLRLTSPGIVYYRLESAASMFFWSRKHRRFLRVWLSD